MSPRLTRRQASSLPGAVCRWPDSQGPAPSVMGWEQPYLGLCPRQTGVQGGLLSQLQHSHCVLRNRNPSASKSSRRSEDRPESRAESPNRSGRGASGRPQGVSEAAACFDEGCVHAMSLTVFLISDHLVEEPDLGGGRRPLRESQLCLLIGRTLDVTIHSPQAALWCPL